MNRWNAESIIALVSMLILGAVAIWTKSEVAVGALISMATYNGQKFWEVLKIKLGAQDAKN